MCVIAEQCVQATQYEAASALPPVCRETRTEVANRIVVQCAADSEQEGTLVIRVHLAAFVRCLEVKRQSKKLCVAVIAKKRALHIRCCRQANMLRQMHCRVQSTHRAVEYKPRVSALGHYYV